MLNKKQIGMGLAVILILIGCDESRRLVSTVEEKEPSNWYIRLIAEDSLRDLKTQSTQLGQLDQVDATQKHTLKALDPFGGDYLDVVFENPEGVGAGEYKTNFHTWKEDTEDRWYLTVKSSDVNAEITLKGSGLYVLSPYIDKQNRQRYKEKHSANNPLLHHMKLIESSSGKEIAMMKENKMQTYTFTMGGQNRKTFEWVVQHEEVEILTSSDPLLSSQMSKQFVSQKREVFDLNKPPLD